MSCLDVRSVHERGLFLRQDEPGCAIAVEQTVAAECSAWHARDRSDCELLIGQCHGFIRLPNAREIYFHRADLQEGTAFNDLQIGDAVAFEVLEDAVSGARALRVVRRERPR